MSILKFDFSAKKIMSDVQSDDLVIELNDDQLKEIQNSLLEMLNDILDVCERHEIRISLGGGSALGAIRHKGFIPWDDDLDLNIPREDYIKLVSVFEQELSDRYILCAPNYDKKCRSRFPKILKRDSYYESAFDARDEEYRKLFVDLFIMENVPVNPFVRRIKGVYCNILEAIAGFVTFRLTNNAINKEIFMRSGAANYYLRIIPGTLFSIRRLEKWNDSIDKAVQYNRKTGFVNFPTGRKHYFGEILEYDKLFPLKRTEFCGIQVPIFADPDYYLRHLYGDNYMTPPPVEKRERHFIKAYKL